MTRGEIWRAEFGIPYGGEPGFTRHVLIVQDDSYNESRLGTIAVLLLCTNLRLADAPGNVLLSKKDSKLPDDSVIIAPQLYAIDRGRFKEKLSKVPRSTMEQVEIGMKLVLGIG